MKLIAGGKSDVGRVRDMNQDAYLLSEPLFGIADGMGGHAAGDVAAATAVETVRSMFESTPPRRADDLATYLEEANEKVYRKATNDPRLHGMGTTFTLIHFDGDTANLGHVGDSRAYLYRDGELKQITKDHTLVQRMVDEGRISPAEAPHHPQRNVISRALGVDDEIEVDTSSFPIRESDRLLICSDGLTSMVSDEQIASILGADAGAEEVAGRLVSAANEAGGEDNITVVIIDVVGDDDARPTPSGRTETPLAQQPRDDAIQDDAIRDDAIPDDRAHEDEPVGRGGRSKRWILWMTIPILILVAGVVAVQVTLANSWFVGATDSGDIEIYKGRPEEIAGFDLRERYEGTGLNVNDLPAFLRADVSEGIIADSLEAAEETVENLRQRSEDFGTPDTDKRSD